MIGAAVVLFGAAFAQTPTSTSPPPASPEAPLSEAPGAIRPGEGTDGKGPVIDTRGGVGPVIEPGEGPVLETPVGPGPITEPGAGEGPLLGPGGPGAGPPSGSTPISKDVLDDIVLRLAREGNTEGEKLLEAGNFPQALTAFLESHALAPDDAGIANNLAFTYHRLGNTTSAELYYRLTLRLDPKRTAAYLNLADLMLETGDPHSLESARQLLLRAREISGNTASILLRQARVSARLAELDAALRYYQQVIEALPDAELEIRKTELELEVGDLYRDLGRPEEAQRWYERVEAQGEPLGAERLRDMQVDDEARRFGWTRRSVEISARARGLLGRARAYVRQRRLREAAEALGEALRMAPLFTEARVLLGDVERESGDVDAAELTYLRGLAYDQGDPECHVRLAELYLTHEGRAGEAVALLERAVQLQPQRHDLLLLAARAYRLNGDLPHALRAVDTYLENAAQGEQRWEAQVLRAALQSLLRSDGGDSSDASEVPLADGNLAADDELRTIYNRVRALLARGDTGAAMAELSRATESPDNPSLRNLKARILHGAGRTAEAIETFESSLELDPEQRQVHVELGLLRESHGMDYAAAAEHFRTAAYLGHPDATYHLARLGLRAYRSRPWPARLVGIRGLWRARHNVRTFLGASPSSISIYQDDAIHLAGAIDTELQLFVAEVGALLALVVLLSAWRLRVTRGGTTLEELLAAHPHAGPDVQRVLSAIRHEVLKHNTMVLTGLAEAIAQGEPVGDKAAHACRTLIGPDGGGNGRDAAVLHRLNHYLDELQVIGRTCDVRLNLRRRDPATAALVRGFALLRRLAPDLAGVDGLSPRGRRHLAQSLERAAHLLNSDGYEAVRALLDRLRALPVDEPLLKRIFERTRREPALVSLLLSPLDLDVRIELPCDVCVPRTAFEDILGNLLRNAIQSSARAATNGEPIAIGLAVDSEVNLVTGHERLLLMVRDRAPQPLALEVLRSQKIEGGLGLTAELVSRYDGTLDVDTAVAGWSKAVVVKLPRDEPRAS